MAQGFVKTLWKGSRFEESPILRGLQSKFRDICEPADPTRPGKLAATPVDEPIRELAKVTFAALSRQTKKRHTESQEKLLGKQKKLVEYRRKKRIQELRSRSKAWRMLKDRLHCQDVAYKVMSENAANWANQIEMLKEKEKPFKRVDAPQGDSRPLQGAELESMNRFQRTYDDLSAKDVVEMLDQLNNLVEDIACRMAKRWVRGRKPDDQFHDFELPVESSGWLKKVAGAALYQKMDNTALSDREKDLLLQFAWRACIFSQVSRVMTFFSIASPGVPESHQVDEAIRELSKTVFENEVQPSYARWRTMTYKYLKSRLSPDERSRRIKLLKDECTELCYYAAAHLFKTECPDSDAFAGSCAEELENIILETVKFADAVKEVIASGDYVVLAPRPGDAFAADRMMLEDNEPAKDNDVVCCGTQLGLEFHSKSKAAAPLDSDKIKVTVPKKAEVATEEYLQEVLRPTPAPPRKYNGLARRLMPGVGDAEVSTDIAPPKSDLQGPSKTLGNDVQHSTEGSVSTIPMFVGRVPGG